MHLSELAAQVLQNRRAGQLDSFSLFCCASCLTSIGTGEPHWFRNKWIHGNWIQLCTRHRPAALSRLWCLLPPRTYVSGFSALTSMKTKCEHGLCVENESDCLKFSQTLKTLQSYVRLLKLTLLINLRWVFPTGKRCIIRGVSFTLWTEGQNLQLKSVALLIKLNTNVKVI